MRNQPKTYSVEFKHEIREALKLGRDPYDLMKQYSIPRSTLFTWMDKWGFSRKHALQSKSNQSVSLLHKQNQELRAENQALKYILRKQKCDLGNLFV